MTNKKKMYKYTSIISMAIVLMLIANLVLPMFSMADDGEEIQTMDSHRISRSWTDEENNTTEFGLSSVLTRTMEKNADDIYQNILTLDITGTYNGSEGVVLRSSFVLIEENEEDPFSIDEIREALSNSDETRFEEAIGKLEELDSSENNLQVNEEDLRSGETMTYRYTAAATSENNGDYYAIVLARRITEDGSMENIGANVCKITIKEDMPVNPVDPTVEMDSISVKTAPTKMEYTAGEEIDLAGGVIEVHYNNNETENVDMSGNVRIVSGSPAAENTPVVISYTKDGVTKQTEISNITVNPAVAPEKTVSSIEVKTAPTKTTYNNGEAVDLTGGVITVTYDNGDLEDIDMKDSRVSVVAGLTADVNSPSVKVLCGGKEATFNITVNPPAEGEKTVDSIVVKTNPTKTTYNVGDTVDLAGGKITVKYSDGTSEDVDMVNNANITSEATVKENTSSVTISYAGKQTTFNITVNAKQEENNAGNKENNNKNGGNAGNMNNGNSNNNVKPTTTTVNPNKATQSMPQTGSNNTAVEIGILVFSLVGIVNFIKYKRS